MLYGFGGMGLVGGVLMLVVWVAIVLLIVWAVRSYVTPSRAVESDTPLAILQRRYAAGEISQTEYEQTRRVLQGGDA